MGGNNTKEGEPKPAMGSGPSSAAKPASQHSQDRVKAQRQGSSASAAETQKKKPGSSSGAIENRKVLGKYMMSGGKEDIMGKGTSSICRKGIEIATNKPVAIKMYKDQQTGGRIKDTTMQKFKRQIAVLKELMEPFPKPKDPRLWNDVLADVKPAQIFMQLIDYSQDADGTPAPDPEDGVLYVVTELAAYSLKDFLADRREKQKSLSKEAVRDLSKRITLAMAGLHAKGFVHIDMKPENMMVFDGRLKVIDVDGCVRAQTKVSINDGSISFSPCYCAPEWARFMIKESEQTITADPMLDVWSAGMTLCELVTLDAIWKPQYANFMRNAHSHREAGFLFLEWLGDIKKPVLPRAVEKLDPGFLDLLMNWLLVTDVRERKTCAECCANPYLAEGGWAKYSQSKADREKAKEKAKAEEKKDEENLDNDFRHFLKERKDRGEDESVGQPLHQGTMFKLNTKGDPKDDTQWIKRDMWLARNHSLCYFSVKENKRLVLVDGEKLSKARIQKIEDKGVAKEFGFEIVSAEGEEDNIPVMVLATDSKEEMETWITALRTASTTNLDATFVLGAKMAEDLQAFKLAVRNRRMKVEGDEAAFAPVFKAKLWKLKAQGDHSKKEDWFQRDMWLAKNGSLVYFSPKENRELVYYTASDTARAKLDMKEIPNACKPNTFSIQLASQGGVEFEPGEFAADTPEEKDQWKTVLAQFMSMAD